LSTLERETAPTLLAGDEGVILELEPFS
jgi:hypothetical protein